MNRILSLLNEYPRLGAQGILSALNSNPNVELEMPTLERLLGRLVTYDYLLAPEWRDEWNRRHISYELKQKGRDTYRAYIDAVQGRVQPA